MTNVFAPFGLQDYNRMEGGSPQFGFPGNQLNIASSDTTPIFDGDPVQLLPAETIVTGNAGKYITQGSSGLTTNTSWEGIFRGCHYIATGAINRPVWSKYWPGAGAGISSAADAIAFVETDVRKWFIAQCSTTGGVLGSSNVGMNIAMANSSGVTMTSSIGNTVTGFSGVALASSTAASTNTLPFRIIDMLSNDGPGFVPFLPNNIAGGVNPFGNGTDNTSPGQIIIVAMNNFGPNQLTGL